MTHRKADLRVSFKRLNDRELPFEPSPIRSPKDLDGIIQTRSPAPTARRTRRRVRFADPEPESEAPQLSDEVEARLTTFGSLRLSQRSSAPGSPVGILDGLCASLPEDAEPGSSAAGAADAELRFWDSGSDDLTRAAPGSRPRRPQAALPRRLEALRWSAADAESGPPSPGLDCFGQWPAEIAEEEGPEGPANPGARPPEAYQMAVRAAMLAWEDPSATLAERVRLADMLRAAFGVTKAAHLRAMRSALRQNACAAEELEARTLGTDEEFVEDEAWARWWEAELRELQALLRQQRRLPRFNAMLEVAVLEASNLREKKLTRKLGVVKRLDEVQHYGLVEVAAQRPVSRRRNADRGSRAAPAQSIATSLRTGCSRGQNPAWHCKTRPVMLHRPPQSLRVSVCTRGMFSDEQDAPPDGNGASPATMAVDIPSPHGHQVLGRSTLHLAAEGGDPETSFLLPVHCQAPLMRKRSGLKAKPPKHVGTLAIVVRYVPEMRQAASYHGDSVGRTFSTASAPAAPSSRVTSSGSAASSLSACSGPSVLPADREPATPHLLSSNDASQTYELLASLLWECWKRGPPPFAQECHGHTFVVGQGPGGIPSRVRSRLSVESGAGTGSGSGGGHATGASEGDGDLSGFCPGRPWNGILDAAAKLYRVRGTWRRLVMVKLMLGDWRLEVDYLAALQRLWEPVVAIGRNGEFTKREAALHAECSRRIVSTGVRALETYPVSLGRGRAAAATVLRSLLALISLAVRYDTDAGAMLEPLKTHIRRSVRWQMSESLPKDDMTPDECIEALSGACLRAASGLRRDLEVADAFPSPLDLPAFTAGLRYAVLARHALELFTGPGVVAYDKRVMELHDRLNELHNLMVASGVSRPAAPGDGGGGGSGVALLSLDKLLGRSILKWARDVGLNMRDWADSAIAADKRRAWRRVSQGAFVSPSVVDLMHIISEVIERAEDRSAGLEETGRLRAEVFERLQAGIHHVVRRYATVLGELFCEDLSQAERRRLAALASTNPRGLETAAQPPSETAQSRPCVGERACVFLSNLSALHDGLGNAHSRLVTAAFGDAFPSPPASPAVRGGAPIEDDAASASLSDISFISDEPEEEPEEEDSALWDGASDDSAGAEAVASSRPADFAFWDRPGEDASGLGPDGRPAAAPGGTVLMEARRSLQRLCGATSRAVAAILGSCSSALASAIKAKVHREVVALLRPVRDDAASQSEVMQGPFRRVAALQGVLASLSWSRDGRRDQAVAPEPNSKGASQLADEELESFMDGLLDREICLLSQNLPPSAFRDAVATAFCSLLAALEDLVLGTTRHCGPLTPPEGRLLARVLEAACAWFHCGGDGLPLEELHQLSQRLRVRKTPPPTLPLSPPPISRCGPPPLLGSLYV